MERQRSVSQALPERMRALRLPRFGGPEVLEWTEVAVPAIGPDDVLIAVAYCGICRHDLLTRSGAFPSITLPVTLGHQVSGHIAAVGERVRDLAVGTRVLTLSYVGCGECEACRAGNQARCRTRRPQFLGDDLDGGYAEYVRVPADIVAPVPDALALDTAAVMTCTLGTAYHALVTRGALHPGETVVITGVSGGVGMHALQLAKLLGARVIGITGSAEREAQIRSAGADEVVVAPDLRFARAVKALTSGHGADAVLDIVGARTLAQSLHALRDGGRVVVVGNVDGGAAEIQPALFILKEISVVGTKSCTRPEVERVLAMVAAGQIQVAVERTFALAEGALAHRELEEGRAHGRLVLEVSGGLGP